MILTSLVRIGLGCCFAVSTVWSQVQPILAGNYIGLSQVPGQLQRTLLAVGDRLQKPGSEIATYTGTLARGSAAAVPIRFIWELPGKIRLEEQVAGGPLRITVFDGDRSIFPADKTAADEDLLETLVNDGAEHFLFHAIYAGATRFLGSGFRLDDGVSKTYAGPFHDVYQTFDIVKVRQTQEQKPKHFYFNSTTGLLEMVQYNAIRDGTTLPVVVRMQWKTVRGQALLTSIRRDEGKSTLFDIVFTDGALSARLAP